MTTNLFLVKLLVEKEGNRYGNKKLLKAVATVLPIVLVISGVVAYTNQKITGFNNEPKNKKIKLTSLNDTVNNVADKSCFDEILKEPENYQLQEKVSEAERMIKLSNSINRESLQSNISKKDAEAILTSYLGVDDITDKDYVKLTDQIAVLFENEVNKYGFGGENISDEDQTLLAAYMRLTDYRISVDYRNYLLDYMNLLAKAVILDNLNLDQSYNKNIATGKHAIEEINGEYVFTHFMSIPIGGEFLHVDIKNDSLLSLYMNNLDRLDSITFGYQLDKLTSAEETEQAIKQRNITLDFANNLKSAERLLSVRLDNSLEKKIIKKDEYDEYPDAIGFTVKMNEPRPKTYSKIR